VFLPGVCLFPPGATLESIDVSREDEDKFLSNRTRSFCQENFALLTGFTQKLFRADVHRDAMINEAREKPAIGWRLSKEAPVNG